MTDKKRIIVVNKEPSATRILRTFLERTAKLDLSVTQFNRTNEAYDHWSDKGADLIITGNQVGPYSGLELMQKIYSVAQDDTPPMLLVSSFGLGGYGQAVRAHGIGAISNTGEEWHEKGADPREEPTQGYRLFDALAPICKELLVDKTSPTLDRLMSSYRIRGP